MQKTRKYFDGEQEKSMASIDRLPDDILVHILSLMSTRRCVQSSILGKRWRFLWARVPNLKLDSRDHKTVTSFSNFFNRFVFTNKGQNINTFSIVYNEVDSEYKSEIEKLIATAIACNVQVIAICSGFGLMLPQSILTSKTLADLSLVGFSHNNIPMDPMTGTTVYLPALKKLELIRIRYGSEKSLEHLLSGCPALEELTILKMDNNVVCVYVSSPTLTRLDLAIHDFGADKAFEVKLDTPSLKYLKLHDYVSEGFSAGMLASLTEADVVFDAPTDSDVLYSRSVLEFVGKLNNVSCLKLKTNWNCMEVPDSAFSALTIEFRNLTKLELVGDLRFVTIFLENSNNLEVLSIRIQMTDNLQYWMEPKQVPVCMIYHLGIVRFFSFKCSEPEFDMVKYILRNAKVLKRMEIRVSYYSNYLKKKPEALKRISLFERASEACQLRHVSLPSIENLWRLDCLGFI